MHTLRPPTLLLLAIATACLAGCASPQRRRVENPLVSRETPQGAYEYLKAMVAAEQVEEEWKCFSPGFRRRLSQRVGRTVDVGDYVQARSTVARNDSAQVEQVLGSEFAAERPLSENVALVTIRAGERTADLRFVRLTSVSLTLRGEGQPVEEFVPRAADIVAISPEGDVKLSFTPSGGTASYLKDVPQDRIQRLVIQDEWYLDDFGGVEDLVVGGLKGSRGPTPPPRQAPPPVAPPGSPDGPPGSPDGATGSPDGGWSSPDGPAPR